MIEQGFTCFTSTLKRLPGEEIKIFTHVDVAAITNSELLEIKRIQDEAAQKVNEILKNAQRPGQEEK